MRGCTHGFTMSRRRSSDQAQPRPRACGNLPHREENPDPNNPAVIVIARSTQEAIVVNLPDLYAISEKPARGSR
jgi:hypothetical protein